jgi:hypothetical protein
MYEDEKMSIRAISEYMGGTATPRLVSLRLEECGIEQRTQQEVGILASNSYDVDCETLRWLYEDMQMSTTEIGKCLGVGQSTIVGKLSNFGIKARPAGYWGSYVRKRKYKPVRSIDGDLMIYMRNHPRANSMGYVKLHIIAYEKHYGEISKGYRVHIVDGDVDNLSKGNLRAMSNSEHSKFHVFANMEANECVKGWLPPCPNDLLPEMLRRWDEKKKLEADNEFII